MSAAFKIRRHLPGLYAVWKATFVENLPLREQIEIAEARNVGFPRWRATHAGRTARRTGTRATGTGAAQISDGSLLEELAILQTIPFKCRARQALKLDNAQNKIYQ